MENNKEIREEWLRKEKKEKKSLSVGGQGHSACKCVSWVENNKDIREEGLLKKQRQIKHIILLFIAVQRVVGVTVHVVCVLNGEKIREEGLIKKNPPQQYIFVKRKQKRRFINHC